MHKSLIAGRPCLVSDPNSKREYALLQLATPVLVFLREILLCVLFPSWPSLGTVGGAPYTQATLAGPSYQVRTWLFMGAGGVW